MKNELGMKPMRLKRVRRYPMDPRLNTGDTVKFQHSSTPIHKKTDPFYLSKTWRSFREAILTDEMFCRYCWVFHKKLTHKKLKYFTIDHFKPRRLWTNLSLTNSNGVPSCKRCHDKKRALETQCRNKLEWMAKVYPVYKESEHKPEHYHYG